jgi:alpha,alpha-trehalose phosphorylase
MRDHDGRLLFAPRLPSRITRLRFRLAYQGRVLEVAIGREQTSYRLHDGEPLDIHHHGRRVTVTENEMVLDNPPAPEVAPVSQPPGAAPRRRGKGQRD